MKQFLFAAVLMAGLVACGNADKSAGGPVLTEEQKQKAVTDSSQFTTVEWLGGTFQDLGKVTDGQVVEVSFRFRNSGTNNLIIENVTAGCGCTVPEKPGRPYAPGEEGVIKAKFDSRGRKGNNDKYVTVKANTKPTMEHVLSFKIFVNE
jgi:hypothetical protein